MILNVPLFRSLRKKILGRACGIRDFGIIGLRSAELREVYPRARVRIREIKK